MSASEAKTPARPRRKTADEPAEEPGGEITFVRGSERLQALRARHPELVEPVAVRRREIRQADRDHAMGLAMIRHAANLTQAELASVLGVGQAAVAKMERRPDLLLSTLQAYLEALGGQARLVVEFGEGVHRIDVPLESLVGRKS